MKYFYLILIILFAIYVIRKLVNSLDYMNDKHPDYRGNDLFDEDNYE